MFINRANLPGFLRPMGLPYDPYGLGWEIQKPKNPKIIKPVWSAEVLWSAMLENIFCQNILENQSLFLSSYEKKIPNIISLQCIFAITFM